MIRRRLTAALVCCLLTPAAIAELATVTELGPPQVRLEAAEALRMTRACTLPLRAGENRIALPLGALGLTPADAWIEVEPADVTRVIDMQTDPQAPNVATWRVQATSDVVARVNVTYPVKGLAWAIDYVATLSAAGGMELAGNLRVTNGSGRDLRDARLVGDGFTAELSVANGETVTRVLPELTVSLPAAALERSFIFDAAVHGDAPVELLAFRPSECLRPIFGGVPTGGRLFAPRQGLPAGALRLYAAAEAGGGLITTASIPYVAPDEAVELPLGPATGIIVTRTRAEAKEVNQRLDAANKVALYDLQERWELEARNLRAEPVELLVREHHEGVWVLEQADVRPEREDAETLVFRLTLAPGERTAVSYRIRHVGRQP
jgi:hypothetical protein